MLLIRATHRIGQWAAPPLASEEPAAGGVFRALVVVVASHVADIGLDAGDGWDFGVPGDLHLSSDARHLLLVTVVVFRAAVAPA